MGFGSPAARFARVLICIVFALLIAGAPATAAPAFPPLSGRVVDEAGILTPATREQIAAQSDELEKKTGDQFVVATFRSLQGYAIEDFGYQLGRAWGIGQKGKDTGAILIVAPTERKVRIEVGYGLEDKLTDAATRSVIESIILPSFRRGDFDSGVRDGAAAIVHAIAGVEIAPQSRREAHSPEERGIPFDVILIVLFFLFIGGRGFFWPLLFIGGRGFRTGGYGGGFGGGASRGFSGGGGSFGGGGASGSW